LDRDPITEFSMNLNSVVVVGRVLRPPELRYSPSGAPRCSFGIAIPRRPTDESGRKAHPFTVVEVETRRLLAEICAQSVKKGRQILVVGTLRLSRWVDPKSKEPQSKLRVVARQIQVLGRIGRIPKRKGRGCVR
jgi:single-strand DNA-binding protein